MTTTPHNYSSSMTIQGAIEGACDGYTLSCFCYVLDLYYIAFIITLDYVCYVWVTLWHIERL